MTVQSDGSNKKKGNIFILKDYNVRECFRTP